MALITMHMRKPIIEGVTAFKNLPNNQITSGINAQRRLDEEFYANY